MQNQGTTWHKRREVIILILLGTIVGLLPAAVPMNWFWMLVCWLVWGTCIIWLILIAFSSKTSRNVVLVLISIALVIGGVHRVGGQWLKDHPIPRIVYRLPVNHLPEQHKEPTADETANKPAAELPRKNDVSHQKQEIRPVVKVNAVLRNLPNNPALYSVNNEGPIDVLQLKIELLSHRVHKDGGIGSAGWGGDDKYVEKLPAHTSVSYYFPEHCLDMPKKSAEESVVEIRLTYSYGPDMKKAIKSVFYFVNPKGLWVGESDSSLTPVVYDPIKKSLFQMLVNTYPAGYEPDTP